jgi:hypothetical protein
MLVTELDVRSTSPFGWPYQQHRCLSEGVGPLQVEEFLNSSPAAKQFATIGKLPPIFSSSMFLLPQHTAQKIRNQISTTEFRNPQTAHLPGISRIHFRILKPTRRTKLRVVNFIISRCWIRDCELTKWEQQLRYSILNFRSCSLNLIPFLKNRGT